MAEDTSRQPLASDQRVDNNTTEHVQLPLVVDEHQDDDNDSALGSDTSSDTTSIASWIFDFREENGRTYHSFRDGAYFQPNDEIAKEHLDLSHALFLATLSNKLTLVELPSTLTKVLDIGTGTGIWAVDFADEHPEAGVIGTDLSPIQPSWTPPNCQFEIDDADSTPWTFADNSFDFIHVRSLFGSIRSWPDFYKEAVRCLKPGGIIEHLEFAPGFYSEDGTVTPTNSTMGEWGVIGEQVFERLGRDILIMQKMAPLMTAAGFTKVTETIFKWPIGTWPKDPKMKQLGFWVRAHIEAGLENWSMRGLTGVLGWSKEAVLVYCANMRKDLRNRKLHGIHEMRIVYATKPE